MNNWLPPSLYIIHYTLKMSIPSKTSLALLCALALTCTLYAQSPVSIPRPMTNNQYVNVFIGTNGMGHTFPGACYPYGSVQLSPDTDTIPHNVGGVYQPRAYDYCAGYQYRDNTIVGFSHTHFSGTGHSDLGDLLIMPYSGATKLNPGTRDNPDAGYRQRYDHATESATPGYYEVTLADDNIHCELTATEHCGIHRYTYAQGAPQRFILDLSHGIYNYDGKVLWSRCTVDKHGSLITGCRLTNGWSRENYTYFAIRVNKPILRYGGRDFYQNGYKGFWHRFDQEHDFPEMAGRKLVTWFEVEPQNNPQLEIYVALSATSAEGALRNLSHDLNNYTQDCSNERFDCLRQYNEQAWTRRLGIIEAEGTEDQKAMLYTSLYHCLINPSLYQDCDGRYRGLDHEIHDADANTNYTVFSVWDTYRAFHPLLTLLDSGMTRSVVQSFMRHQQQSPHHMLPVWSHNGCENWCMIGYHGVSVLADALGKGYDGSLSHAEMLRAMTSTANCSYYDHTGLYKQLGYLPVDKSANGVSITLENAYEDWCIYHTLQHLGQQDTAELDSYRQRALSYRNVFDTTIGFARARLSDGSWKQPYSLLSTSGEGFIEGNAWNYSFYVPHDVNGLMRLMGGEKLFVRKLDTLFTMYIPDAFFAATEDVTREGMLGGYVHGNEPSHHIPYLYMWTSQPWKTQYWVREIMNRMYRNHMDGLCGNDDCGQMSAWYIFSAMGFYPVCPGSGEYVLGAPYMPYMKVTLASGNTLEIKAPKVSDKNRYIQKVTWNGQPYDKSYVTHEMLMQGGTLEFTMGPRPNKRLFQHPAQKPYSLTGPNS